MKEKHVPLIGKLAEALYVVDNNIVPWKQAAAPDRVNYGQRSERIIEAIERAGLELGEDSSE